MTAMHRPPWAGVSPPARQARFRVRLTGTLALSSLPRSAAAPSPWAASAATEISANVSIDGLGANNLIISGNKQSGVFGVDYGALVSIAGLTVEDGYASQGGGIANAGGMLAITGSTISDNSAYGNGSDGGGVDSQFGTLTITDSTLANNSAWFGGGIYASNNTVLTVINSTLANNSALADGGGIFDQGAAALTVYNSTIADNSASAQEGGGIANVSGGWVQLLSTVVADNTAGGDLESGGEFGMGSYIGGWNLIGDGSYFGDFYNSQQGDPLLAPLGTYGGPTLTMPPLSGSPAISNGAVYGDDAPLVYDRARGGWVPTQWSMWA